MMRSGLRVPSWPVFTAPDGVTQWRVGRGGLVERSEDGGATWPLRTRVETSLNLKAGAAPTADAAWLVGDAGVVLRWTSAGQWQRVDNPTDEDLVSVSAGSPLAAQVRTRSGLTFETSDGGSTWRQVQQ